MTTLMIAAKGTTLTEEQKAARAKAHADNVAALAPFLAEAKVEVAKRKNIANPDAMDSLMNIKQIAAEVYAVAKVLKAKAEGKTVGLRQKALVTKFDKFSNQLRKAIGFAKKHKIPEDKVVEAIQFAVANPIMAERKQPKVESAEAPKE